jgi:hypothetical protein
MSPPTRGCQPPLDLPTGSRAGDRLRESCPATAVRRNTGGLLECELNSSSSVHTYVVLRIHADDRVGSPGLERHMVAPPTRTAGPRENDLENGDPHSASSPQAQSPTAGPAHRRTPAKEAPTVACQAPDGSRRGRLASRREVPDASRPGGFPGCRGEASQSDLRSDVDGIPPRQPICVRIADRSPWSGNGQGARRSAAYRELRRAQRRPKAALRQHPRRGGA